MKPFLPGNMFVVIVLTQYIYYFFNLLSKHKRENIKITTVEINALRKIPIKTVDEQKRFLDMRYPKSVKFKYTPLNIIKIISNTIIYFLLFFGVNYMISEILGWEFSIGFGIFFIIIFPLAMNYVLRKFNLNRQDMSYLIGLR